MHVAQALLLSSRQVFVPLLYATWRTTTPPYPWWFGRRPRIPTATGHSFVCKAKRGPALRCRLHSSFKDGVGSTALFKIWYAGRNRLKIAVRGCIGNSTVKALVRSRLGDADAGASLEQKAVLHGFYPLGRGACSEAMPGKIVLKFKHRMPITGLRYRVALCLRSWDPQFPSTLHRYNDEMNKHQPSQRFAEVILPISTT